MSSVIASSNYLLANNLLGTQNFNYQLDQDTQQKQYDQLHLNLLETIKIVQQEMQIVSRKFFPIYFRSDFVWQ